MGGHPRIGGVEVEIQRVLRGIEVQDWFISAVPEPVVGKGPVSGGSAVEAPQQQEDANQQPCPREEQAQSPTDGASWAADQSHPRLLHSLHHDDSVDCVSSAVSLRGRCYLIGVLQRSGGPCNPC